MKTGNAPKPPQCSLGRLMAESFDAEGLKAQAWNEYKILVVAKDDNRLTWTDRELLIQLGERLYGKP